MPTVSEASKVSCVCGLNFSNSSEKKEGEIAYDVIQGMDFFQTLKTFIQFLIATWNKITILPESLN